MHRYPKQHSICEDDCDIRSLAPIEGEPPVGELLDELKKNVKMIEPLDVNTAIDLGQREIMQKVNQLVALTNALFTAVRELQEQMKKE